MKLKSFDELFLCLLSDIYIVENLIVENVPSMMQKAHSEELKEALGTHLNETKEQVKRLDKIFSILNKQPSKIEWGSDVQHLFADAGVFLQDNTPSPLLDAAIIAITQRIEHFEIATYGTLCEFADVLDYEDIKDILEETIKEEGHADKLLTTLAEGGIFKQGINATAAK